MADASPVATAEGRADAATATTLLTTQRGTARPEASKPAARRSLRRRLVPPLAVTAAVHVVIAVGDRLPAVDALAYFQAGRNLLDGDGYTRFGTPELHFPPLVPVGLGLLERLTGSEMAALGTWNVLSSLAVTVTLTGLAHRIWRDEAVTVTVAWLGGTMTGLGPLFFRHGSGSESTSLALLLGAVLAALAAADQRSQSQRSRQLGLLLAAGLLVGLAYLARPELLVAGALVGVAAVVWTGGGREQGQGHTSDGWARVRPVAAGGGAFFLGVVVLVGPYVTYLHRHTGTWSLTAKSQDVSVEAWRAVAEGNRRERDRHVYALSADATQLGGEAQPLTQLAVEHPVAWLGIVRTNAAAIMATYGAPQWSWGLVWQAVPVPLVGVALVEVWRERHRRPTWLLTGIGLVSIATCLAFFTLPRYLVVPTAVLTLYAARGLLGWCRGLRPRWAAGVAVAAGILVASSSLTEVRPFLPGQRTADPVSHYDAGIWLASYTSSDARVMTRSYHVQAYADRPVVAMPVADYASTLRFARLMGVSYLVADPRSPHYEAMGLSARPPGLRLVAVFGRSNQPLRVYQLDPLPPPSERQPIPLGYVAD